MPPSPASATSSLSDPPSTAPLRCLELFCGIGGAAVALGSHGTVRGALDIDQDALAVYRENLPGPTHCRTLESLSAATLQEFDAELWWLSPPCQPFTSRGRQRDLDDPRCQALITIGKLLGTCRPRYLALENVPAFATSQARRWLGDRLETGGYQWRETQLCPTELGIPMKRQRYYLIAARQPLPAFTPPSGPPRRLPEFLLPEAQIPQDLYVDAAELTRYAGALHVVAGDDPRAVTACFTSAYGKSPIRSGSYLQTARGIRRFDPREILRLLGFPWDFQLPPALPRRRAWSLVGNSLAIPAVRHILKPLLEAN